jgi:hypothetical protein
MNFAKNARLFDKALQSRKDKSIACLHSFAPLKKSSCRTATAA